ncbi:hypothetical protein AXF42_Ash020920 [Apostasia shenzhenica]|uniref:F-box domain-containing protein n=1 Tax=Apostasia shenzhenica TaxID=1088818 RepID=A0A2H9ZUG3_9ASPA|nr:hypothetical protein AXF42_Ash020920 [Apostasia shenzhenica]
MDKRKRCRSLGQGEGRQWSELPDLALNQIAVRVSGPGDFLAFGRVCRSWRAVAKTSIEDFEQSRSSIPQHLLVLLSRSQHPHISGYSNFFYSPDDGFLYEHKPAPKPLEVSCKYATHSGELSVIGQSHCCIIAVDAATRRIPSLIEIRSGRRFDFPPLGAEDKFDFALLTASVREHINSGRECIRSRCRLVLVDSHCSPGRGRLLYCILRGHRWHIATHPGPIIDAIVCFDKLVINCSTSLLFLRLDRPCLVIHRCNIPAAARGGEGKRPLLVVRDDFTHSTLLFLNLNDNGDSVSAYRCYCIQYDDGKVNTRWEKYIWTLGTNMFLNWQRSDLFCTFDDFIRSGGVSEVRSRLVNPRDEFWENYFFETNGVSVSPVDGLVVEGALALSCFQLLPARFLRGIP